MKNIFTRLFAVTLLALAAVSSQAAVIIQNTGGTRQSASAFYDGESFTTPSDFLYYNLPFNFYSNAPATTPAAAGTAFLLSQPYTGTPAALSVTTPGFLTESTSATGGIFTFNPNFVLLTSTVYYLYTNSAFASTAGGSYTGGTGYFAVSSSGVFTPIGAPLNFSLNGTPIGAPLVPEPSSRTSLYVLSGVVGLGFVVMRRRRAVA